MVDLTGSRNKIGVAFLQSPLQLLYALDFAQAERLSKCYCVVFISPEIHEAELLQYKAVSTVTDVRLALHFVHKTSSLSIRVAAKLLFFMVRGFAFCPFANRYVLVGDRSQRLFFRLARLIMGSHLVLLDDGAASLKAQPYLQWQYGCLISYGMKFKKNVVFTAFDFKNYPRKKACHLKILSSIMPGEITWDENQFFFVGQKLSERGVISLEDEFSLIERIRNSIPKSASLTYIAHRADSEEKIQLISGISEVKRFDTPLEIVFARMKSRPNYVFSFMSTALLNIKVFDQVVSLKYLRIPKVFFSEKFLYLYDSYNELGRCGVQVEDLEG